jgi:hypothetical protein
MKHRDLAGSTRKNDSRRWTGAEERTGPRLTSAIQSVAGGGVCAVAAAELGQEGEPGDFATVQFHGGRGRSQAEDAKSPPCGFRTLAIALGLVQDVPSFGILRVRKSIL